VYFTGDSGIAWLSSFTKIRCLKTRNLEGERSRAESSVLGHPHAAGIYMAEAWQRRELTYVTAKVIIYEAFVEGKLEALKHLADHVCDV